MYVSAHTRDEVARVTSPVTDDNELSGSSPTLASDLSAPESHVPDSGSNERDAAASTTSTSWGPDLLNAHADPGGPDMSGSPSGFTDHDLEHVHHRAGDEHDHQHRHRVQHGHAHERTTTECAGRYESPSDTGAFMPTAQAESPPRGGPATTQNCDGQLAAAEHSDVNIDQNSYNKLDNLSNSFMYGTPSKTDAPSTDQTSTTTPEPGMLMHQVSSQIPVRVNSTVRISNPSALATQPVVTRSTASTTTRSSAAAGTTIADQFTGVRSQGNGSNHERAVDQLSPAARGPSAEDLASEVRRQLVPPEITNHKNTDHTVDGLDSQQSHRDQAPSDGPQDGSAAPEPKILTGQPKCPKILMEHPDKRTPWQKMHDGQIDKKTPWTTFLHALTNDFRGNPVYMDRKEFHSEEQWDNGVRSRLLHNMSIFDQQQNLVENLSDLSTNAERCGTYAQAIAANAAHRNAAGELCAMQNLLEQGRLHKTPTIIHRTVFSDKARPGSKPSSFEHGSANPTTQRRTCKDGILLHLSLIHI